MTRTTQFFGAFALVAAFFLTTERTAQAQPATGFVVNNFEPSERGSDWFTTESLDFRGPVRPGVGVIGDYATKPLASFTADGEKNQTVVKNTFALHAGATINLLDRFRVVANLPLY